MGAPCRAADDELVQAMRACLSRHEAGEGFDREALSILLGQDEAQIGSGHVGTDARIEDALSHLESLDCITRGTIDELAVRACLSKSRLSHLFSQEMGISLHRYLAFAKMKLAARYASEGATLTDAAIRAGFDSSSHLSSTVRRMFGITLTDIIRSARP